MPLALLLSTLKVFLVDLKIDLETIGLFSLIALPYSIKFLWAPLVDSISLPFLQKLGRRRSWMVLSQILLIIFIFLLGSFANHGLLAITIITSAAAFASATQDMAVDAYRIEKFSTEDQGFAASFYVYGYRIGMLISGAFALFLSELIEWQQVYFILACIMTLGLLISLIADTESAKEAPKAQKLTIWFEQNVLLPLKDFLKRQNCYFIFAFIIAFKLCDAFAGTLTLPFLLDIGFSKGQIAAIVKTFGLFATLFGAFCGAIIIKKIGMIKALWAALILQGVSNLAFCLQAYVGADANVLYGVIFVENFSGGIGDAVFVAYLSSLCNVAFTATQYSLLVSAASSARVFLSSGAGVFAASFGWVNFFFLSFLLAIPAVILLALLRQRISSN